MNELISGRAMLVQMGDNPMVGAPADHETHETPSTVYELQQLVGALQQQKEVLTEQLALAQQQIQQMQHVQQHTAALLGFELRTQSTTVLGSTELLSMGLPGPVNARQGRVLQEIDTASRRLFHIVDMMMEYQQVQAGITRLERRDLDAGELCRTVLAHVSAEAAAKHQVLRLSCPDPAPRVHADERRLQIMLDRLLRHALHCAPHGGCIDLAVAPNASSGIEFRISNNGAGVCADEPALLFMPFTAANYGQAPAGEAGVVQTATVIDCVHGARRLGVALARELAELHGGALAVENRPGQGGSLTLTLPAGPTEAARAA